MTAVLRAEEASARYLVEIEPTLTRGFELLATADGGTERLRSLIVSMALNGRLTSEPGRSSPFSGGAWPVVRLSELAPTFQNGASSRGDVGGVPTTVIRLADITAGEISAANPRVLPIRASDRQKHALRCGDILVIRVNGSADLVGRFIVCRTDMDAIHCDHFIRMRFDPAVIWPEYLRLVGDSANVRDRVASLFVSTAGQKTVNQGHIGSISIALPPIEEQVRIVARVEELMKLCDALEQNGRLVDEQHARLTSTLFDALAASESAHALAENWQRVSKHFDLLLDRPEAIDALEQTILQLAVRGLLVRQNLIDGSALELISEIADEKRRLVSAGQIRPEKEMAGVASDDKAFPIPNSWAWVRFGQASINRDGERIPVASADREHLAKIYDYYGASGAIDKIDRFLFDKTLLLIGEDGANLINRSTPIAFLAHGKFWVNNHAHVIDVTHEGLLDYLCLYINAMSLEAYVTGTAQPKMNQSKLNSIPVALPPLAEQKRIVARVEELHRLCAELRQRLTQARETQSLLADALVAEVA